MSLYQKFNRWFIQQQCIHEWRPAVTSKGPARHCSDCDKTDALTEAEFYAFFGRMPIL